LPWAAAVPFAPKKDENYSSAFITAYSIPTTEELI